MLRDGEGVNKSAPTVGVWPGHSFVDNEFIGIFADSLIAAGCKVVDVSDPRRVQEHLDILHIHWPEQVLWMGGKRFAKARNIFDCLQSIGRMKRRGTKVVWMVHNVRPHELKGMRRFVWPLVQHRILSYCDAFMTLSPSTVNVVREAIPALASKPAAAAMHPLYPRLADVPDRGEARRIMSLPPEGLVIALLGMLRPYKGAESLIAAFCASRSPNSRLLIAGQPITPEYGKHIKAMAAGDSRIDVRLGYLNKRDFAICMEATDVVVLPYHAYLHSGAVVHAVSCGRPVITPATPFANDVAKAVGEEWVVRYSGQLTPDLLENWTRPIQPPNFTAMQPSELGRTATELYRSLL